MTLLGAKKQKIDLLKRYSFDPVKHEKTVTKIKYIVPGAATVLVLAALIIALAVYGIGITNDTEDMQNKIDKLSEQRSAALALEEKNKLLTSDYMMLSDAKQKALKESSKYSYFGEQLLDDVKAACGDKAQVMLMDFSSDGILFTFKTTSKNYRDISGIVENIEALSWFTEIEYTGYSETGDDAYSFSVVCRFEQPENESEAAQ